MPSSVRSHGAPGVEVKRFSDRPRRDAIAISAYWAIWCGTAFAIGVYFFAYGTLADAIQSPMAKQALYFAMPVLVGIVALSTNPLLQFRRNSEAMYIVSRARDGRPCEAEFFLYLRPFTSDGRIRAEGTWLIDNPLALIGRRTDLEGALTSQLARKLGLAPIAIGRDRVIGAGRVHLPDDEWQSAVRELIRQARFVVLLVSGGAGISWEIEQCLDASHLRKTVFIWPPVSKVGAYDPASDNAAVRDVFARLGRSVTIGSRAGDAFFWDGPTGWHVVGLNWPKKRSFPRPVLDRLKEIQSDGSRTFTPRVAGVIGVIAVVATVFAGYRVASQVVIAPSVQFGMRSDEQIVARFEQEVADSPLGAMFARLRSDFPDEYQEYYRGIIDIARSGGTEEEQIIASNRYSQVYMSGFWRRHRREMQRAEPEVISRWIVSEGEALAALGNVNSQACAEYFEEGNITPEIAVIALPRVAVEFGRARDVMFDLIESGQRAPQQYELIDDEEWSALYEAALAAGASASVLDVYGTPNLAGQPMERRCETGIAFYRAIAREPDQWKRARLGSAMLSVS
jgi:hypothetical protein